MKNKLLQNLKHAHSILDLATMSTHDPVVINNLSSMMKNIRVMMDKERLARSKPMGEYLPNGLNNGADW